MAPPSRRDGGAFVSEGMFDRPVDIDSGTGGRVAAVGRPPFAERPATLDVPVGQQKREVVAVHHRVRLVDGVTETGAPPVQEKEGEVASVELLTRGKNQRPSGSAVVEYRYSEAAAAAVQALEGTELDGRDLRVRAYFSN